MQKEYPRFDIDKMLAQTIVALEEFAKEHSGETFYAFGIEASMLCLNSIECLEKRIKEMEQIQKESFKQNFSSKKAFEDFAMTSVSEEEYQSARAEKLNESEKKLIEMRTKRYNTADWEYQEFASLEEGFSFEAYDEHYYLDGEKEKQRKSEYHRAMQELINRLNKSNSFAVLQLTPDFQTFISEHDEDFVPQLQERT